MSVINMTCVININVTLFMSLLSLSVIWFDTVWDADITKTKRHLMTTVIKINEMTSMLITCHAFDSKHEIVLSYII